MTDTLAHSTSYDYMELAALLANGKMVRNHYVRKDDPAKTSQWRRRFHNTDVLSSIGFLREPNNSSACILPMHFDIDCLDDLEAARGSTITLCEMLMDRIRLSQDNLDIAFSGNKGFHVVIAPEIFRAFYSPHTLELYRRMARRARDAGVRHLDESVYTRRRLWRLTNSRHGRSGLFKVPLRYEELRDIGIDGIKKLAANPRPDNTLARHQVCEEAAEWYRKAIAVVAGLKVHSGRTKANRKFRRGWRMPPCIKAIEAAILPDGLRHHAYFALPRAYRAIGMHRDEIRERLEALDSRNPIRDSDYIGRTIEWACAHPGFPGCDDESLRRYCHPESCFYHRLKNARDGKSQVTRGGLSE